MDLHWPELVMLGGLLCMAQFAAVRGLFKQESSRAVSLWSRSGMLLGIALLLWGLSVHLPPDIAVAGAMVLALIGLLGLMGLILALRLAGHRPVKVLQTAAVFSISAALAWGLAALAGMANWGGPQQTGPNDTLWLLLIGVSALGVIVGNLRFVGLFLEQRNRQILQLKTQQAHQEQALRWSEQMVQWDRQYGLGGVAASLAHELSQPLTNLYLITDRLEMELKDSGDQTLQQCIQDLQSNTQKAGDMLGRIRSFVRSRDRRFEPVQLGQVIEGLQQLIRHMPLSEGLLIRVSMPDPAPVVWGECAQLTHLLMNVARNAIEATTGQGVRQLDIRVWQADQTVHVSLSDNGPGMSAEALRQAGTAFFSTKAGGMGVGLTISKSMAKHHGGQLKMGNLAAGGACIELQLPAHELGSAHPAKNQASR